MEQMLPSLTFGLDFPSSLDINSIDPIVYFPPISLSSLKFQSVSMSTANLELALTILQTLLQCVAAMPSLSALYGVARQGCERMYTRAGVFFRGLPTISFSTVSLSTDLFSSHHS